MTDIQKLCKSIKYIALGYVLLYFDINLGKLSILPDWLGFLLILHTLPILAEHVPSAALLRRPAILLIAWYAVLWIAKPFNFPMESYPLWQILYLIAEVVALYFHFQLLTDLATLSEEHGCPQTASLRRLRTVNTLIGTAFSLPLPWEKSEWLAIVTLIVYLIVWIWISIVLFGLKRNLALEEAIAEEE